MARIYSNTDIGFAQMLGGGRMGKRGSLNLNFDLGHFITATGGFFGRTNQSLKIQKALKSEIFQSSQIKESQFVEIPKAQVTPQITLSPQLQTLQLMINNLHESIDINVIPLLDSLIDYLKSLKLDEEGIWKNSGWLFKKKILLEEGANMFTQLFAKLFNYIHNKFKDTIHNGVSNTYFKQSKEILKKLRNKKHIFVKDLIRDLTTLNKTLKILTIKSTLTFA